MLKTRISFIIAVILFFSCNCQKSTSSPPNFIVILTDDQQYYGAGFTGNPIIHTPNLDRMAATAMQFTEAHVAFSLCSPSRATILTGRYGIKNGVLGLGSALNNGEQTFANRLKEEGYATAQFGKWHIKQTPDQLGFDTFNYFTSNGTYYGRKFISASDTIYPDIHCDEYAVNKAIQFLASQAEHSSPFLLFLCTQTPHMNGELIWDAKETTKSRYNVANMPVPTNHLDSLFNKPDYLRSVRNRTQAYKYGYPDSLAIQQHTRDYYAVISEMDNFIGQLFDKVTSLGLSENTYIIFMSDNGWMLGDHGFTSKVLPYQPSTHVPFWIAGPNIPSSSNASLVSNLDIFPTILSLAEIPIHKNIHGKSLSHLLKENTESLSRDHLIYEGLGTYGESWHNLTVISPNFRYIETYTDSTLETIAFQELYNRSADFPEMNNLVSDIQLQATINTMQGYIANFKETIINQSNE